MEKRVRRDVSADIVKRNTRFLFALNPQIDSWNFVTALDDRIGEVELPIKLKGPRMDGQSARCCSWLRSFVDDARLEPEFALPEPKDQTGRASSDNQNIAARHIGNGRPRQFCVM